MGDTYLVLCEIEFVLKVCDAMEKALDVVLQTADLLLPRVQLTGPLLFLMLDTPTEQSNAWNNLPETSTHRC